MAQGTEPPWRPGRLPSWRHSLSDAYDNQMHGHASQEEWVDNGAREFAAVEDGMDNSIDHLLDDELRSRTFEFEEGRPATAPLQASRPNTDNSINSMTPRTGMHIQSTVTSRLAINKRSPPRSRPASPIRHPPSPGSRLHSSTRPSTSPIMAASSPSGTRWYATYDGGTLDMQSRSPSSPRPSTAAGPVQSISTSARHGAGKSINRPTGSPPRQRPILTDPPLRFHIPARPATGNKGYTSDVLYPTAVDEPQNADMRTACVLTQLKKRDRCRRKQFRDLMTQLPRSSLEQSLEDQLQRMTVRRKGVALEHGMLSSRSIHYVAEDSEELFGNVPLAEKPFCLWEKGANIELPIKQLKRVDAIIASTNEKDLRLGRRKVQSNFDPVRRPRTSPAALRPTSQQRQQRAEQSLTENWEEWLIAPTIWRDSSHYARLKKLEAQQKPENSVSQEEGLIPSEVSALYCSDSFRSALDSHQHSSLELNPNSQPTSAGVVSVPSEVLVSGFASSPFSCASLRSFSGAHESAMPRSQSVKASRSTHSAAAASPPKSHSSYGTSPTSRQPWRADAPHSAAHKLEHPGNRSCSTSSMASEQSTNKAGKNNKNQKSLSLMTSRTSFGTVKYSQSQHMLRHSREASMSVSPREDKRCVAPRDGEDQVEHDNMYSSSVFREYLWRKGFRQPASYLPTAHLWPDIELDISSDEEGSEFEFSEDKAARRAARKAAAQKPWLQLQAQRRQERLKEGEEEEEDVYTAETVKWEEAGGAATDRSLSDR